MIIQYNYSMAVHVNPAFLFAIVKNSYYKFHWIVIPAGIQRQNDVLPKSVRRLFNIAGSPGTECYYDKINLHGCDMVYALWTCP